MENENLIKFNSANQYLKTMAEARDMLDMHGKHKFLIAQTSQIWQNV